MKKLTTKAWAKVLAFVLFVVCTGAALVCAHDYQSVRNLGLLRGTATFESTLGKSYAENCLYYIQSYLQWSGNAENTEEMMSYCGESFAYTVTDGEGNLLADTRTADSRLSVSGVRTAYGDTVYVLDGYINIPPTAYGGGYAEYVSYRFLHGLRNWFLPLVIVFGLLAAAMLTFLILSAGKGKDGTARRGLNRLPPEVFLLLCLALPFAGAWLRGSGLWYNSLPGWPYSSYFLPDAKVLSCFVALAAVCVTAAARIRSGGLLKDSWLGSLFKKLSLPWKLGLGFTGFAIMEVLLSAFVFSDSWYLLLLLAFDAAVLLGLLWVCGQAKKVRNAGMALAAGQMDYKVETKFLLPALRAHGEDLNRIGDGMAAAVAERMKSERLKTELITNVSHDLKTPLTGIVTYIDLLKKEELPGEKARAYVVVLERQSARLKKLTEDLVEASKAAAGAIAVEWQTLDAAELLSQSVGEYSERLADAGITPVVNVPEGPVPARTDGRLLWRVMDNLIGNVVKYALPGTRAYFDLSQAGNLVRIEIKNISSQALNISADELMERFVRGDSARSTEGSGLGLSIARSLTELLGGRFFLTLDGDLFKATVELEA